MAEWGWIVTPTAGAAGSGGQLTSNSLSVHDISYRASYCEPLYDSHRSNFASYLRRHSGTDFTANQRPALYYRPSLDHTDNPQFGLTLSDCFMTQTKRLFQPGVRSDFWWSLPSILNKRGHSGFHQLWSHPRRAPPVEEKTENQRVFVPHRLPPAVSRNNVTGPKGDTGFTKASDLQLHTFQERGISNVEPRRNCSSVMKNDFLPPSLLQDTEATPGLCSHSCRETGFTRGAIAPLACPTSLLPSPRTERKAPAEKIIGQKEPTGSLRNVPNHHAFPKIPFDGSHFITQYRSKFCYYAAVEQLRSAPTGPRVVRAQMDSGYSRRGEDRFISMS